MYKARRIKKTSLVVWESTYRPPSRLPAAQLFFYFVWERSHAQGPWTLVVWTSTHTPPWNKALLPARVAQNTIVAIALTSILQLWLTKEIAPEPSRRFLDWLMVPSARIQ